MDTLDDILKNSNNFEDNRLEFKTAKKGLPLSIYETYSSFANTSGGYIILGIHELKDKTLISAELNDEDIDKLKSDLFNTLNNKDKVSINLISNNDVYTDVFKGHPVLIIKVKEAEREYKPVYLNKNIYSNSYKRDYSGDYVCSNEEIKTMISDSFQKDPLLEVITDMNLSVLSNDSINEYRNRLNLINPTHIFLKESGESFLEKLNAAELGDDGKYHPTKAGLLMFGYSYKIIKEFPHYFLDYREYDESNERWINRYNSDDGTFSGNIFDFYFLIAPKLTKNLSKPFKLNKDNIRVDDTSVHKALREALVNSLTNANYNLNEPVLIEKEQDKITFKNSGLFRMNLLKAEKGGHSDPRNFIILKMFNLIGVGERAGSGIPTILNAAKENNFETPKYELNYEENYVKLHFYFKEKTIKEVNETVKSSRKLTKNEEKILVYLLNNEKKSVQDITNDLDIPISTTKRTLYKLMEYGYIKSENILNKKIYSLVK